MAFPFARLPPEIQELIFTEHVFSDNFRRSAKARLVNSTFAKGIDHALITSDAFNPFFPHDEIGQKSSKNSMGSRARYFWPELEEQWLHNKLLRWPAVSSTLPGREFVAVMIDIVEIMRRQPPSQDPVRPSEQLSEALCKFVADDKNVNLSTKIFESWRRSDHPVWGEFALPERMSHPKWDQFSGQQLRVAEATVFAAHLGHSSAIEELLRADLQAGHSADTSLSYRPLFVHQLAGIMAAKEGHTKVTIAIMQSALNIKYVSPTTPSNPSCENPRLEDFKVILGIALAYGTGETVSAVLGFVRCELPLAVNVYNLQFLMRSIAQAPGETITDSLELIASWLRDDNTVLQNNLQGSNPAYLIATMALMAGCEFGSMSCVNWALSNGATVDGDPDLLYRYYLDAPLWTERDRVYNSANQMHQACPIGLAITKGQLTTLEFLFTQGVKWNASANQALLHATIKGSQYVIGPAIDYALTRARTDSDDGVAALASILDTAALEGCVELLKKVLDRGANITDLSRPADIAGDNHASLAALSNKKKHRLRERRRAAFIKRLAEQNSITVLKLLDSHGVSLCGSDEFRIPADVVIDVLLEE